MKKIHKLLSIIICALLLITSIPDTENILINSATAADSTETALFYEYLKNYKITDPDSFPENYKATEKFSALIDDFNGDGKKEMMMFGFSGITLLGIYNGKVTINPKATRSIIEMSFTEISGNGSSKVCAEYKNKVIYIYSSSIGFGGSYASSQYMALSVDTNNNINIISNYISLYNRGIETWSEAGQKNFPDEASFSRAVKKSGFSVEEHYHNDYFTDKIPAQIYEGFRGNHIFSLYISNWDSIPGVISGYLYDNTQLKSNMEKPTQKIIRGDVNFDNKVTATDARLALRASVKLEKFSETQTLAADVDNKKGITAADARIILRASVGLEKL